VRGVRETGRDGGRQESARRAGERLVGVSLLGLALLSYPLLSLADRPRLVAGIPLLYLYLFGVWALLIALLALLERRSR
jgi:hypothetical protein